MTSKKLRHISLFVAILILAGLFLGAFSTRGAAVSPPPAQLNTAAQDGSGGNISARQAPGWTAATRPWTKERMLAAKPMSIKAPADANIDISPEGPQGRPGFAASALPRDARAPVVEEADMAIFSPSAPLGYTYPAPFTRYRNFSVYTKFPYVTVGKLFFSQCDGGFCGDYVCSASSIGNYAIWTAGHCVHAGNNSDSGWSYDVVFVPAYNNGSAPRGTWYGYDLWTTNAWFSNPADNTGLRYDMGGVILETNGSGDKISEVVGNLGFAYNEVRNLHWFLMGYPAEAPFSGGRQNICAASYAYNYTSLGTPYPSGVGCDMTGGSSGGPWIYKLNYYAGPTNYLNGENSFGRVGYPKEMFSPYFGDAANNLWNDLVTDTAP